MLYMMATPICRLSGAWLPSAATLATWMLLLSGSGFAQDTSQKCYACGPQAEQWYKDSHPPSCANFTETENYVVNCGDEYDFCSITLDSTTNYISRLCSKNSTNECLEGEMKHSGCSCNATLCNGKSLEEMLEKEIPPPMISATGSPSTSIKPEIPVNTKESIIITTLKPENIIKNDIEKPIMLTNNENNNVDTGIHIMPQKDLEMVTSHSLPLPAALGQENKPPSQQGAPVDDEEDAVEGSGNRMETERKLSNPMTTTTTEQTTTAKNMKSNGRATTYNLSVLLICTALVYNLSF